MSNIECYDSIEDVRDFSGDIRIMLTNKEDVNNSIISFIEKKYKLSQLYNFTDKEKNRIYYIRFFEKGGKLAHICSGKYIGRIDKHLYNSLRFDGSKKVRVIVIGDTIDTKITFKEALKNSKDIL